MEAYPDQLINLAKRVLETPEGLAAATTFIQDQPRGRLPVDRRDNPTRYH